MINQIGLDAIYISTELYKERSTSNELEKQVCKTRKHTRQVSFRNRKTVAILNQSIQRI